MNKTPWYSLDDNTEAMVIYPEEGEVFEYSEDAYVVLDSGDTPLAAGTRHPGLRVKRPKVVSQ